MERWLLGLKQLGRPGYPGNHLRSLRCDTMASSLAAAIHAKPFGIEADQLGMSRSLSHSLTLCGHLVLIGSRSRALTRFNKDGELSRFKMNAQHESRNQSNNRSLICKLAFWMLFKSAGHSKIVIKSEQNNLKLIASYKMLFFDEINNFNEKQIVETISQRSKQHNNSTQSLMT